MNSSLEDYNFQMTRLASVISEHGNKLMREQTHKDVSSFLRKLERAQIRTRQSTLQIGYSVLKSNPAFEYQD